MIATSTHRLLSPSCLPWMGGLRKPLRGPCRRAGIFRLAQGCGNSRPLIYGGHVSKKLYVGNLPYAVSQNDLQALFESHGRVQSVQIIIDRDTGRSKGFGFIEMD